MNLRVENNNKFVRGKKKARETIEKYLNYYYCMQKSPSINDDYIIFVKYKDDDLKNVVYEIFRESLYGFNHPSHYGDVIIKPVRKINTDLIVVTSQISRK
ncbi:hypothetical protein [Clostridium sp. FP1]|uniref:hypothetical protein n=1 Tax=Clostridium sp. FP1 TaxID=2724076 RepID=UPI0013E989EB|nr:hypothetical protein [Clostridium sp. FP1]MBZ9637490.1 hypothetical protein [Clostridium sp. FP1]